MLKWKNWRIKNSNFLQDFFIIIEKLLYFSVLNNLFSIILTSCSVKTSGVYFPENSPQFFIPHISTLYYLLLFHVKPIF